MERISREDAASIYGIDSWGGGYFAVNDEGHLEVYPQRNPSRRIDLYKVVEDLKKDRLSTPVLLRFPQILASQVENISHAFAKAIEEFGYKERYCPVFPIKVNQQAAVVEDLMNAGFKHGLGIEVGSKPELMAALSFSVPDEALTICNGFKDRDYITTASYGVKMGRKVIVVVEKPFELDQILSQKENGDAFPGIGFRIRLNAKGSGLWEKSGGSASKFGLSTNQMIQAIDLLRQNKMISHLKMLHFHIGSQITEIRRLKSAIKEAARVYAKARKMGVPVEYLNVGGGLGVDYDGSRTSSDASVNYTMEEYANDVVYNIAEVCNQEHVPHPKIVTESGRALVAYHSALIVDVRGRIYGASVQKPAFTDHEPKVIDDLLYIYKNITVKNYREFFHDAASGRDEMNSLFNLGMIELEDRSKGEWLFNAIASRAVKYSKSAKFVADEFVELEKDLYEKYICNFSVFQSIPDHWALDQLFPVVPIHRLNERPTNQATLVDITCDSDGEVEKFVDLKDIKYALEVHELAENEPYYLAFLLIGAYQDTMGDLHNLFGAVNEAHVVVDESGGVLVQDHKKGDNIRKTLELYGYDSAKILKNLKQNLTDAMAQGKLDEKEASKLHEAYKKRLEHYPYLV